MERLLPGKKAREYWNNMQIITGACPGPGFMPVSLPDAHCSAILLQRPLLVSYFNPHNSNVLFYFFCYYSLAFINERRVMKATFCSAILLRRSSLPSYSDPPNSSFLVHRSFLIFSPSSMKGDWWRRRLFLRCFFRHPSLVSYSDPPNSNVIFFNFCHYFLAIINERRVMKAAFVFVRS